MNDLLRQFAVEEPVECAPPEVFDPRYNIAPTQDVIILKPGRVLARARWGLVPLWADDPKIGSSMINARAETVADKPAFRAAFKRNRCLVLADGFYEWKRDGSAKQPYFIRMRDDRPFAFAGLMEHWERDGQAIDSCTVITTEPNSLMAPLHDRMPVILPPEMYDLWLDPEFQSKEELRSLLCPYPADRMQANPVGTLVNSPRHDTPDCIKAVPSASLW